jgi:hypothetical protein
MNAFRRCLEELDVEGIRSLWAEHSPHLSQPSAEEALISLHMARTAAEGIEFKCRAYSHKWLTERGYSSRLPDHLKQSAERIYPRVVKGVGISYNIRAPELRPAAKLIQGAMEQAVLEADANGKLSDTEFVKNRMNEARDKERRALFGRVGLTNVGAI